MGCTSSNKSKISTELTSKQIMFLKENTRYTEKEIQEWHVGFLRDCPNGKLSKKQLIDVYQHFYPQGNVKPFCKYIFAAIDRNHDGEVDFEEYLMLISALSHASLNERLAVAFDIFDIAGDGQIDEKELATLISALYELFGEMNQEGERHPRKLAQQIISKLDRNGDKKLDKFEFLVGCKSDSMFGRILALTA